MTKRELVMRVSEKLGYTQHEVSDVVQSALDLITQTLAANNRIEIRNFGVFELKIREARQGRNPRTGESVQIGEKRVAVFKPGKALKELVEHGTPIPRDADDPRGPAPGTSDSGSTPPAF